MEQTTIRRFTVDKLATMQEKFGNKLLSNTRRTRLNNTDFSLYRIIVGGGVYTDGIICHIHLRQLDYIFSQTNT